MQFLPTDHFTGLIMGLHEVSQLNLPIVVAGAGLTSLLSSAGDERLYAERTPGWGGRSSARSAVRAPRQRPKAARSALGTIEG